MKVVNISTQLTNLNHSIEGASGNHVNLINPMPRDIELTDISWALSRIARFNGHTMEVQPYSVASHSVWVASYLYLVTQDPTIALHGLLHDAHEAYTGDIAQPLKSIPEVQAAIKPIEERVQRAIYIALDMPSLTPEIAAWVSQADEQALAYEAQQLMYSSGEGWSLPTLRPEALKVGAPEGVSPTKSYRQFLHMYKLLNLKLIANQEEMKGKNNEQI